MPDGFLIIDKRPGLSSFGTLDAVKRTFGIRKVGHAGTLDRFASGILVAMVGRYTRLCDFFMASEKTYLATIRFGLGTDTLDPEGSIVSEGPIPEEATLRSALPAFSGDILQTPPDFSAIHVNGIRAYERVRNGEKIELPSRRVFIGNIELVRFVGSDAEISITCSKGTYIRSFARDLAAACGTVAHVTSLRRSRSGPFDLGDAVEEPGFDDLRLMTPSVADALGLGTVEIGATMERYFLNGHRFRSEELGIPATREMTGSIAVFGSGCILGIVELSGADLRYRVVLGGGS
ncbi:MAG: tRNA pseudouridine(55) synthase TruB [Spirochaetes bacterium]|nr:tRNA pseudouridine(55) synthase TruB [Spirochaetota bacterium]